MSSRVGLGIRAVREDEAAAEASGVGTFRHKLLALTISTALAGLTGGAFAYYHVSYYPQHTFSPAWTFDAVLIAFIGGVGTIHGPVLGALFYVILKEVLAVQTCGAPSFGLWCPIHSRCAVSTWRTCRSLEPSAAALNRKGRIGLKGFLLGLCLVRKLFRF